MFPPNPALAGGIQTAPALGQAAAPMLQPQAPAAPMQAPQFQPQQAPQQAFAGQQVFAPQPGFQPQTQAFAFVPGGWGQTAHAAPAQPAPYPGQAPATPQFQGQYPGQPAGQFATIGHPPQPFGQAPQAPAWPPAQGQFPGQVPTQFPAQPQYQPGAGIDVASALALYQPQAAAPTPTAPAPATITLPQQQYQALQQAQQLAQQAAEEQRQREFQQLISQNRMGDVIDRIRAGERQAAEQARAEAVQQLQMVQAQQAQQEQAFRSAVLAAQLQQCLIGVPFSSKEAGEQAAFLLANQMDVRQVNGQYAVVRRSDGMPVAQAVQQAMQTPGFLHFLAPQNPGGGGVVPNAGFTSPLSPQGGALSFFQSTVQAGGGQDSLRNGFGLKPVPGIRY